MATDISRIFADDSVIPRRDLELYAGNIHDIFSYHALRSFVWTSRTWCKKNKKLLSDFTLEDSLALSRFIAERDGLNYNKIDDKSPQIGSGLLSSIVKTTSPQNAEDLIFRLTEDRMTQYDQAVSRFRYTSTCRQITEYLKRPILPSDGDLPDKDLYRDSISRDIEVFNIDSSFVEELRKNLENRTIRIFDNVVCSISRDNINAYANAIIDRKMDQYDRVATAVNALNSSKAELAREKEALENELSHLGIFAGKRKKEIRALLGAMPEREAGIIAQGNQAISDADSPSL